LNHGNPFGMQARRACYVDVEQRRPGRAEMLRSRRCRKQLAGEDDGRAAAAISGAARIRYLRPIASGEQDCDGSERGEQEYEPSLHVGPPSS